MMAAGAHPYSLLRPLGPPREAPSRGEFMDLQALAAPRGSIRLAVDEALLGGHALARAAKHDGAHNDEAVK